MASLEGWGFTIKLYPLSGETFSPRSWKRQGFFLLIFSSPMEPGGGLKNSPIAYFFRFQR